MFAAFIIVLVTLALTSAAVPKKLYSCLEDGRCRLNPPNEKTPGSLSQSVCLLTCGRGHLWPYPSGEVRIGRDVARFTSISASFSGNVDNLALFPIMIDNFMREVLEVDRTKASRRVTAAFESNVRVQVEVTDLKTTRPSPGIDESYSLQIQPVESSAAVDVKIVAANIFGARHALETLSQLIVFDDDQQAVAIAADVAIVDAPAFVYRGLMIDVSRNFIPIAKLQENIRACGYNKLNVLHLHLSDTASLPVTVPANRNLTDYGAYSAEHIYSEGDLRDLTAFATGYGVMLLPEIDAPAHVSAGWQRSWSTDAGLGQLTVCDDFDKQQTSAQWLQTALEAPSGQLNLANAHIYTVLRDLYAAVLDQTDRAPFFHLGGDEVIVGSDEEPVRGCYNNSEYAQPILDLLASQGLSRLDNSSFYALWINFTQTAASLVQDLYKHSERDDRVLQKLHLWGGAGSDSSGLVYNLFALPNYTSILSPDLFNIQVWDTSEDSIAPALLTQGYDVVVSHTDYVYLDCGNAGLSNPGGYWCQPYHEWYHLYDYMHDLTRSWQLGDLSRAGRGRGGRVLGSEALVWTEMVDETSLSQRIWPRASALAEALWSYQYSEEGRGRVSEAEGEWLQAADRLLHWRNKLVARGVQAEALQPRWCLQREGGVCSVRDGTPQ